MPRHGRTGLDPDATVLCAACGDARRQALVQLGAVQQGRDPVGERRAARDARRTAAAAITVEEALAEWQRARIYTAESPWSRTYASRVASALRVHIPQRLRGSAAP